MASYHSLPREVRERVQHFLPLQNLLSLSQVSRTARDNTFRDRERLRGFTQRFNSVADAETEFLAACVIQLGYGGWMHRRRHGMTHPDYRPRLNVVNYRLPEVTREELLRMLELSIDDHNEFTLYQGGRLGRAVWLLWSESTYPQTQILTRIMRRLFYTGSLGDRDKMTRFVTRLTPQQQDALRRALVSKVSYGLLVPVVVRTLYMHLLEVVARQELETQEGVIAGLQALGASNSLIRHVLPYWREMFEPPGVGI